MPQEFEKTCSIKYCPPSLPFYFEYILKNVKCTNTIYEFKNTNDPTLTLFPKWKADFSSVKGNYVCIKDVFKVYYVLRLHLILLNSVCNIVSCIESFLLGTILKKIHIKTSDTCSFCKEETEIIQHVFVNCTDALILWRNLSMHIYKATSKRIGFNVKKKTKQVYTDKTSELLKL
jgi:hypothetical protein